MSEPETDEHPLEEDYPDGETLQEETSGTGEGEDEDEDVIEVDED